MAEALKPKLVIGLMSGTSVDGIDACLVRINSFPDFSFEILSTLVWDYPENIKQNIFKIFENKASIEEICWMNFVIGEYFAQAALEVIKKAGITPKEVDLIGSHGQTVYHKPIDEFINGFTKKSTLQIGESAIIAERTGITTISDFRPADIAAGGQGAPLVCFADEILFKSSTISRAIQNIGGMANVTVISPNADIFAFDTGPGNVMIDYCARKFFNQAYDKDGLLAAAGQIDENWLNYLLDEQYYSLIPPKTTGRELFSPEYVEKMLLKAPPNPYNIMATITALSAKTIFNAYDQFIFPKTKIDELIIGGGGAYNPQLLKRMGKYFGKSVKILSHKDFGVSDKFKEALAFAMLAYTTFYKIPNNVPSCTGAKYKKILGKISYA
ncbi:MAG: anhydro-N-acetylmuramic acid kinase [bacterium]